MTRHLITAGLLATLLAQSGGCAVTGEGTTRATQFYVLRPLDADATGDETVPRQKDLTVAVGPVELAAYLKRPHIVTLSEGNEVRLAEFDRWAEPLEDGITRVLSENLSILLGTHRVVTHGPRSLALPLYTVAVKVVRLDGRLGEEVLLSARWGLIDRKSDEILVTRYSIMRRPAEDGTYGALVAAENLALEDLCREIASALAELR